MTPTAQQGRSDVTVRIDDTPPGTPRRESRVGSPERTPVFAQTEPGARERLITAATRLFYHEGIGAVGVDRVVTEAGVAKMSLYRHFGSKERLIVECLSRLDVRYHDWFTGQVDDRGGEPVDKLLSIFDVLDEWFTGGHFRGCAFINATVELADPQHPARQPAMRHKERNRAYVETLARSAGVADPAGLSRLIMLLVEGAIVTALVQDDPHAAANAKAAARILVRSALPGAAETPVSARSPLPR